MTYAHEFRFVVNFDAARYALYPDGTPELQAAVQAMVTRMRGVMRAQPGISIMSSDITSGGLLFKVTLCRNQTVYDRFFT